MMVADDHILVFFYAILFVTPVFCNDSQDKKVCVQPTKKGHCCKLPFKFEGKTYYSCTKDGNFYGFSKYFWCYNDEENYEECTDPIYRPSNQQSMLTTMEQTTASSTSTVADIQIHLKMSSPVSAQATAFSVASHSSNVVRRHVNSTKVTTSSVKVTTKVTFSSVKVVANISQRKKKSKISSANKARYAVLVGGLVGGIFIIVVLTIPIAVYFKSKSKSKARKESQTEQEPDSRIAVDETENPLYESAAEIDSEDSRNETATKASRGMSEHVYQEVDNAQNSNVNDVNIVASYSPVNDKDGFIHFNELYTST